MPMLFDLENAREGSEALMPATVENALHSLRTHGLFIVKGGLDPAIIGGLQGNAKIYGDRVESAVRAGAVPSFDTFHSYTAHMLAANLTALDPDTAGEAGNDFTRTSFCRALLTDLVRSVFRTELGARPAWVSARVRAVIPHLETPNGRIVMHTEKAVVPFKFPGLHNIWTPLVPEGVVANRDVPGLQFLLGDKTFSTDISDEDSHQRLRDIEARTGSGADDPEGDGFFYRPPMRLGDVAIFRGSLPHGSFVPDSATVARVGADLRVCPLPALTMAELEKLLPQHRAAPLPGF